MDNYLDNGAILPFGLLDTDSTSAMAGFNKTYKNTSMRVGVVIACYPISNERNKTKLSNEYDVIVMEQHEDRGSTTILYRNCLAKDGAGSIADFFEKTVRVQKKKKSGTTDLNNQDGAIVLVDCLDGMTEKAIITGFLTHPDRKTTLKDEGPRLEGEFNGINVKIEKDGSTVLTFKGATDNSGKPLDSKQGNTVIAIEKTGSFQIKHKTVTVRLDKEGDITITTDKNISVTAKEKVTIECKEATVTAKDKAIIEAKNIELGKSASYAVIKGDTFKTYIDALSVATALGPSGPPIQPMPPSALSKKVKTE